MNSIRIKNLRCFKDTGNINLKPLTIAVGKNSCGKSTLLRVFPLFKQSLETKTSEPILWYGRYVDFGEFSQSKTKNNIGETIDFEFSFDIPIKNSSHFFFEETESIVENTNITLHISKDIISKIDILIFNKNIIITYNMHKNTANIAIDNINYKDVPIFNTSEIGSIIPNININGVNAINDIERFAFSQIFMSNGKEISHQIKGNDFLRLIFDIVKKTNAIDENNCIICVYLKLIENILDFDNAYREIRENLSGKNKDNEFNIFGRISSKTKEKKHTIDMLIELLKQSEDKISQHIIVLYIPTIIKNCNSYLSDFFENVKYIAPVRATAERYYRKQGLDIQDVDSRGENVATILQSMKPTEQTNFTKWLNSNFGFEISTSSTEGHISLYIKSNKLKANIADTGFGYSQILPILLMLWKTMNKTNSTDEKQIVIEQPELHLHPKMQVQLVDAMIALINDDIPIKFLLETHSETIINYLGKKIEEKNLDRNTVNILLVEQDKNNISNIRQVNYSDDGYLEEWPLDFFQED